MNIKQYEGLRLYVSLWGDTLLKAKEMKDIVFNIRAMKQHDSYTFIVNDRLFVVDNIAGLSINNANPKTGDYDTDWIHLETGRPDSEMPVEEDYNKIRIADLVISINCNDVERDDVEWLREDCDEEWDS